MTRKILIVDDDDMALAILEHALRQVGYDVLVAASGEEGMKFLQQGDCQLVITDWEMPEMNGLQFCRLIRETHFGMYIYIILLTAHNTTQETVEGLSSGADDFVKKPFETEELIARVRSGERVLSLDTRDVTIFTLAKLVESRDPDTGQHIERVQAYCRLLAQQLAKSPELAGIIDANFIRLLYQTSPLHDIGKVGIPDEVLLKPGKLNDGEFELMKSHALIGGQTLQAALDKFPTAEYLKMARDIALTHHERYDGRGYPNGLSGREIPLSGRIVAVADVYDALTSTRVYRQAWTHEDAKQAIIRGSGSHFDPLIVRAFLEMEEQFKDVNNRMQHGSFPAFTKTESSTGLHPASLSETEKAQFRRN